VFLSLVVVVTGKVAISFIIGVLDGKSSKLLRKKSEKFRELILGLRLIVQNENAYC